MPVPTTIDQSLVAGIVAALAVFLVIAGAYMLRIERAFSRRLRVFIGAHVGEAPEPEDLAGDRPRVSLARQINAAFGRSRTSAELRRQLLRAGSPLLPNQFLYLRIGAALFSGVTFLLLTSQSPSGLQPLATLIGLVLGWLAPMLVLRVMQQRRVQAFERHLPDAIDIMAGSLEAGTSLPMSLELVAREIPAPVSTEFSRALREVSLGMSLDDALINMQERIDSDDLDMLATAVAIQFRVGGNLADVLKVIAHTIRERVRVRGDIRSLTAQQTMSANVLVILPIVLAVLLFFLNPTYEMRLFDPGLPQMLTAGAVAMVVVAFVILRRIVSIDV
ncbi:MAG: type II secretion system F family protein [Chloroflexi bacterium]|nr:type II secretion system F family protein [Chloroflexota bacterium]